MIKPTRNSLALAVIAAGLLASSLTSCVDDKYDLDNLDKTVELKVNDLVLPVNLDPITLNSVIDLDEDGTVREVNGIYAVVVDGTFQSDAIEVDPVVVHPDPVNVVHASLETLPNYIGLKEVPFFLKDDVTSQFEYNRSDIDPALVSMDEVGVDWKISLEVDATSESGALKSVRIEDLKILMPKGLKGTPYFATGKDYPEIEFLNPGGKLEYDSKTGIILLDKIAVNGTKFTIELPVTAINIEEAGVNFDGEKHTIEFSDYAGALSGGTVWLTDLETSFTPDKIELWVQPVVGDLKILSYTGKFKYDIENFNISSIDLSDLPDVLTQDDTNIRLANPQIYLSIFNPVSQYGIKAQTGLEMTPYRDGVAGTTRSPEDPLTIGTNGPDGKYNLVLAPDPTAAIEKPFVDLTDINPVRFTGLSDLLSGKGLPSSISVNMIHPEVPVTYVKNFVLGNMDGVEGSYTFFAPLQFLNGTMVKYAEDTDSFESEDIEKLTITTLKVNATVNSDLPLSVVLTAWPLDKEGKRIGDVKATATIPANAKDYALEFAIDGTIKGLDKLHYEAEAKTTEDTQALSPEQHITLSNLKVTVGGSYTTEL